MNCSFGNLRNKYTCDVEDITAQRFCKSTVLRLSILVFVIPMALIILIIAYETNLANDMISKD